MNKFVALLAIILVYGVAMVAGAEVLSEDEKNMSIAERTRIRLLIEDLANHRDAQLKATNTLIEIGEAAVPMLLRYLRSSNEDIRGNAAIVVGRIGSFNGITPISALLRDPIYSVRFKAQDALRFLARANSDAAMNDVTTALKDLAKDKDDDVRAMAVEVLIEMNVPDFWEEVVDLLKDKAWKVRADAAKALGGISAVADASQQRTICEAIMPLLDDKEWQVVRSASNALGFFLHLADMFIVAELDEEGKFKSFSPSPNRDLAYQIIDKLIGIAGATTPEVRCAAFYALGKVWLAKAPEKGDPIIKSLITGLDDSVAEVRLAAAASLGRVGNEEAVGALIAHLEETVPVVLNVIVESLRARTLKSFGYQPYDIVEESPDEPIDTVEKYDEARAILEEKRQEALDKWKQWWEESKDGFKVNPVIN